MIETTDCIPVTPHTNSEEVWRPHVSGIKRTVGVLLTSRTFEFKTDVYRKGIPGKGPSSNLNDEVWDFIKDKTTLLVQVDNGCVLRRCLVEDALREGEYIDTNNGRKFAIPLYICQSFVPNALTKLAVTAA